MNIRKQNNKYQARMTINGRCYSAVGTTKKQAIDNINKKILDNKPKEKIKKDILFGSWLDEWINIYKKDSIKETTLSLYNSIIRNHIDFKDVYLKNLNPFMIQKSINNIEASRCRELAYVIYCQSLSKAYQIDLIDKDLIKGLEKPLHKQEKGKALTKNERVQFLVDISGSKTELFFKFCLYTGCRRNEALNISWEDIDFVNDVILIRGTKTSSSFRTMPLFNDLKTDLEKVNYKKGKLFKFNPDYVTKTFKKFCKNHKLHDLRHTFATVCLESGISIAVASKWLGHSNISVTAKIYTHILNDYEKEESLKFNLIKI